MTRCIKLTPHLRHVPNSSNKIEQILHTYSNSKLNQFEMLVCKYLVYLETYKLMNLGCGLNIKFNANSDWLELEFH